MTRLIYNTKSGLLAEKNGCTDLGIDLPAPDPVKIAGLSSVVIDTGIVFGFPVFGLLRRLVLKLITGMDITGVGGLIWPKSRHKLLVQGGVIDPGYRGTIKIAVYNPAPEPQYFSAGDHVAQLVPTLSINFNLTHSDIQIQANTERGDSGGINVRRY